MKGSGGLVGHNHPFVLRSDNGSNSPPNKGPGINYGDGGLQNIRKLRVRNFLHPPPSLKTG